VDSRLAIQVRTYRWANQARAQWSARFESRSRSPVLVVEDFEPFRKFVTSKLAAVRNLQVIGEVSDASSYAERSVKRLKFEVVTGRFLH
jgi:hypothetical protein